MEEKNSLIDLREISQYLLPILVISLGLQMLRAFIPGLAWYLRDTVDLGTMALLPYAFGTFLLGYLAALIRRLLGDKTALWLCTAGLAITRLLLQLITNPGLELWLAILGVGFFLNFIPIYIGYKSKSESDYSFQHFAYGLVLGFAFDSALMSLFGTRDISTVAGLLPIIVVCILIILLGLLVLKEPPAAKAGGEAGGKYSILLLAIGAYFTLQMLYLQSQGWAEEVTGMSHPSGIILIMIGYLACLTGLSLGFSQIKKIHPIAAGLLSIYLIYAVFSAESAGYFYLVFIILGQFILGLGLAAIFTAYKRRKYSGIWRTTLAVASGMFLFLAFSFAYYIGQDMALPIPRQSFPTIAAGIFGVLFLVASFQTRKDQETVFSFSGISVGVILLIVPILVWVISEPRLEIPRSPGYPVNVMVYNIHSGFNIEGSQDLESIAQVIENSGASIIGLQEVSRGRLMDGFVDMPTWLAERLNMQVIFKGTNEKIWGNAILSKYPIVESGWMALPAEGSLIKRGILWALIDMGESDPLLVIVTHLHQVGVDGYIREAQVPVILDYWDGQDNTILMGDLNAEPDTTEIGLIYDSGLIDSWMAGGEGPGFTMSSKNPVKRIDYIWHSPDLTTIEIEVIQTQASDHMPVIGSFGPGN